MFLGPRSVSLWPHPLLVGQGGGFISWHYMFWGWSWHHYCVRFSAPHPHMACTPQPSVQCATELDQAYAVGTTKGRKIVKDKEKLGLAREEVLYVDSCLIHFQPRFRIQQPLWLVPWILTWVITELRTRNKPWIALGMDPKLNKGKIKLNKKKREVL